MQDSHSFPYYNLNFDIFVSELHRFGGGLAESEGKSPTTPSDSKQQISSVPPKPAADTAIGAVTIIPHTDTSFLSAAVPSQKLSNVIQKTGQRPHLKWKGPDKISKIYGDWIDDL